MPITPKNIDYLRSATEWTPEYAVKLAEALASLAGAHNNIESQVNGNATGQPTPPPGIQGVNVSSRDGFMHVAIQDENPVYRGIRYYVEHADNPHFENPQIVPLYDARNVTIPIGNQTRYVRALSAYSSSPPGSPVYHGTKATPVPVVGNGIGNGPEFLPSQGSGTGPAGVGLQGPGVAPFRTVNGVPPTRGK